MEAILRIALVGMSAVFILSAAYAQQPAKDVVRAQLKAQGYENISFAEKNGTIVVHASRGKLTLTTTYDQKTGQVISEQVNQANSRIK